MKEEELKEAMRKAVEFEKNGFDVYSEAAEKTSNPLVKKTFEYLAEQEEYHIQAIKKYLDGNGLNTDSLGDDTDSVKEFFNTTRQEFRSDIEAAGSDIEAYDRGMELEKSSYSFYKTELESSESAELKDFFRYLMDQESAHYVLLEKMKRYLEDPSQYHAEEESWMFEG